MLPNQVASRNPRGENIARGKPKREQSRSHLLSEIAAGVLSRGDALVAERHLANVMKISRSTMRQTLDEMEREGIILRWQHSICETEVGINRLFGGGMLA